MTFQRDFWARVAAWTAALMALAALLLLAQGAVPAGGDLPRLAAVVLPLAALLAGIGATRWVGTAPRAITLQGAAAASLVGVLAFGLNVAATAAESGGGLLARARLRQEYAAAVDRALADPELSPVGWSAPLAHANTLGWEYHYHLAGGAVAVLMAVAGLLVGAWLSLRGREARRTRVVALAAVVAAAWLFASVVLGLELSQQSRVAPALTAWMVALAPAVAVLSLWRPVRTLASTRAQIPALP